MKTYLTTLALISGIAFAGTALAQETAETDQEPAAATTEAEAGTESDAPQTDGADLPLGQTDTANAVGSSYDSATHGDWVIRCIRSPEGQKDPCQLYQLLKDEQGNSVAEIGIFPLASEQNGASAGATVITPLETLLTEQLRLSVDGSQPKRYPFTFCSQVGCFARLGFTAGDINSFKRGNAATLIIAPVAAPDQRVNLAVSLTGFTAGFDALKAQLAE